MMASAARLYGETAFPATPARSLAWRDCLNRLRHVALECRSASHADLFETCARLANQPTVPGDVFARAFFRCVRQSTGTQPIMFRPGVAEISFDEAWLMRAIVAADNDHDSFAFLIRSRIPKQDQRNIAFLINGISASFVRI
ncbi:hypothetical protein [Yoonia sp. SS1-5]|uniref:Uncharacterized protein n=1 Tax=Yoonia rhodophyticola TaxID=3137370 RepID=A0AAN0MBH9_9RHOB